MNRTYKWIIIVVLLVSFVSINALFIMEQPKGPQAENGILDLRGEKFPKQGLVLLSGEWMLYPDQLLSKVQELEGSSEFILLSVPGSWNKRENAYKPDSAIGHGTYRLKVRMDVEQQGIISFRVPLIRSAHRLFINGEEVGSKGLVAQGRDGYSSEIRPYIAQKDIQKTEIDIFVQVSNFDFKSSGGIIKSIQMGSLDAIVSEQQRIAAFEFATIIVFLILALFFLFIHFRHSRNGWIFLTLFFFCNAVIAANQGSKWFLELFPELPPIWSIKFYWLFGIGHIVALFMFVSNQHQPFMSLWFRRVLILVTAIASVTILLTPISSISGIVPIWLLGQVFVYCYVILALLRSVRYGDGNALYNLIAICLFVSNAILNTFIQLGMSEANIFYFVQVIGVSMAFSIIFLNQFFRVYRKKQDLSLRLKQLDLSKNQFMASISEQMEMPLNAVISIVDARIQSDNRLTSDQIHELRMVTAIGWKMRRLVDDLLDYSKWKDEGIFLNLRPLNLQLAADEVIERVRFLIFADSVTINNHIQNKVLPLVLADEQRLSQILTGLISHALKLVPNGVITIDAATSDQIIQIEINMQGILSDSQLMLKSLIQDTARKKSNYNMAALDLTLITALIELHEGTLTVVSDSLGEASFLLSLPVALEFSDQGIEGTSSRIDVPLYPEMKDWLLQKNEKPAMRKLEWEQDIGEMHVLIIDDDPISLKMLTAILSLDGYHVITMKNAKEAFLYLQTESHVDAAIVNSALPDQSGIEVCRQIRVNHNLFELPILLLTNARHSEYAILSNQAGANDFLAKPVEASELRVRVRTLLQLKQSVGKRIQMELAFLQAQIKPHFLFNTLNSIAALSKRQPEEMGNLLTVFGDYLRESFRFDSSEPLLPFDRELKLIKSYLHIEKVRFEDWLSYDIQILTPLKFRIPPLTIQPLIENAVRHGIMQRANGGHIRIQIWQENKWVCIQVKDNGVGMTSEGLKNILQSSSPTGGIGISNIDRRLKQLFGFGLIINSTRDQGTDILIRLPIERVCEHESNRS